MIVSCTCLHYGADYLYYALRSVVDHADRCYVLYSAVGSHGARTDRPCPDSRESLYRLAKLAAKDKLIWYESEWANEGQQRETIHTLAPDADVILVVDVDEIWPYGASTPTLIQAGRIGGKRTVRIPLIHFWRSFYRAVVDDVAAPVRIIYPQLEPGDCGLPGAPDLLHFGYAQRAEIVEYKQYTHGHRAEWRPNWYAERFAVNAQRDCHPVVVDYWNPQPVNPWLWLPSWMKAHPYANKELIV